MRGSRHRVDFLVEVPLKNGMSEWILLHIELQARGGDNLPFRMYYYKSLIFAMYKRESVALAIVTDKRPKAEAGFYRSSLYNTTTTYEYNRLVVSELDEEELLATDNPFDLALCAAQRALKSRRDERRKHDYLQELLGLLGDRGWSHEDKRRLLLFMEKIINLRDRELILDIVKYQEKLNEEGKIVYIPLVERVYRDKWIEEGLAQGIAQGIEQGMEQGKLQGEHSKAVATARKMLARHMTVDVIADLTGLSEDEVRGLMN